MSVEGAGVMAVVSGIPSKRRRFEADLMKVILEQELWHPWRSHGRNDQSKHLGERHP